MIIINGVLTSDNKLILDEGFIFGRSVFETILIKDKPIFLKEHINRINSGAKALKIKNEISEEYVLKLLNEHDIRNCALKIILSPENTILTTRPITYKKHHYEQGFFLNVSSVIKNETSLLPYLKWTGYIENLLIKEKANEDGFDDAIMLNSKGYITETTIANIFFFKENTIHTPAIDCGLLDGIVRNWIIENYSVIEGHYTLDDLINSQGVFLTNSLMGIIKVSRITGLPIKESGVLKKLVDDYSNLF